MKPSGSPAWLRLGPVAGLAFLPLLLYVGHPDRELNRPIPALGVMFPLVLVGSLLCYRPNTPHNRLVHDLETDVIISLPIVLVAIWALLTGPSRLSDHYWLWRPDLQSWMLFTVVAVALMFGTRSAISFLPTIACLAITQLPIIQILVLGDKPQTALVAATAASFAGLPLVMTRRIFCRRTLISAALLVVVAGGIGVVSKLLVWPPPQAGALGALVGFGTVFLIKAVPLSLPKFPLIAPVPLVQRLTLVALFAGGLTLATTYSLNAASPSSATSHLLPKVEMRMAYTTPDGFTMRTSSVGGWFFTLAQAPSWTVLLGHPDNGALRWVVAQCPGTVHMSSAGVDFLVTRFQNPESYARYVRVTWYGLTSAHEVFRAGLIAWDGTLTDRQPILPPVGAPDSTNDTRRTLERLIRSAKLSCSTNPLPVESSLLLTATHLAAGNSQ